MLKEGRNLLILVHMVSRGEDEKWRRHLGSRPLFFQAFLFTPSKRILSTCCVHFGYLIYKFFTYFFRARSKWNERLMPIVKLPWYHVPSDRIRNFLLLLPVKQQPNDRGINNWKYFIKKFRFGKRTFCWPFWVESNFISSNFVLISDVMLILKLEIVQENHLFK